MGFRSPPPRIRDRLYRRMRDLVPLLELCEKTGATVATVKAGTLDLATAAKWLPGTGRYTVTARRTGAPRPTDPLEGTVIFEARHLINKLFPACLSALDQIMLHTPLTNVPGYHPGLDQPSRINLPWNFSDTTGHRLQFLYGITELR